MSEITIERLGHEGDGIAAGPIFVPRTLPGEVVSGEVENGRMTDARIVTPSASRVRPPCRHFKTCGGCALQHASDAFVADWKREVVVNALTARGIRTDVRQTQSSPERSRRRAVLSGRRTKKGSLIGFHGAKSSVLVETPECMLVDPKILSARPILEELLALGGSRKAELRFTVTVSEGGLDIMVSGGKPLDRPLESALGELAGRLNLARLSWDHDVVAAVHTPSQLFGRAAVVPPPGAFLQATQAGEDALLAAVQAATSGAKRVVDLFAGCGTFSLPLSERADVHAVEGLREMTDALATAWRRTDGLHQLSVEARDLFRRPLLSDELDYDAAVIDPPRAGAEAQTHEIAKSSLKRIAFVSCNPVTFARDAQTLIDAGFSLEWVEVVDQFRWSPHVELAALFARG